MGSEMCIRDRLAHRVRERRGEELGKPRLGACVALFAMYETADLRMGQMGEAVSALNLKRWEPGVLVMGARGTGRAARNILRGAAREVHAQAVHECMHAREPAVSRVRDGRRTRRAPCALQPHAQAIR